MKYPIKVPRNAPLIAFQNVAKDFKQDYVLFGKTKSGRYKLGEISGWGPDGLTVHRGRMSKITITPSGKKRHKVYTGGSPFNSYYYDE